MANPRTPCLHHTRHMGALQSSPSFPFFQFQLTPSEEDVDGEEAAEAKEAKEAAAKKQDDVEKLRESLAFNAALDTNDSGSD